MEQTLNQQVMTSQVKYASFGRRLLAYGADYFFLFVIGNIIQAAFGSNPFLVYQQINTLEELQQLQASGSSILTSFLGLIVAVSYYLILYVNYDGATPGKRLMAIKVTKEDGSKVTYATIFVRYIGTFVSAYTLLIGYFMSLWDKKKQTLHDKIAKTVVIQTEGKPKTLLATVILLVAMIIFVSYLGVMMYKGYQLGMQMATQEIKSDVSDQVGQSMQQYQDAMNPEAKIHYDKAMQLFKDMRAVQTDSQKVIKINDENIAELKQAIELDPENAEIWYQLGNAYTWKSSTGTMEDGISAYQKAEELDPSNVIYINGVGDMLMSAGQYEEAILQFQKTFRITDQSGYANLSIATAYAQLGITDTASEHYQKAIDIFSSQNSDGDFDNQILQARKGLAAVAK